MEVDEQVTTAAREAERDLGDSDRALEPSCTCGRKSPWTLSCPWHSSHGSPGAGPAPGRMKGPHRLPSFEGAPLLLEDSWRQCVAPLNP